MNISSEYVEQLIQQFVSQSLQPQLFNQISQELTQIQAKQEFFPVIIDIISNQKLLLEDQQLIACIQLKNWLKSNTLMCKPLVNQQFDQILKILANSQNIQCFRQNSESLAISQLALKAEEFISITRNVLMQIDQLNQSFTPFVTLLKVTLVKQVCERKKGAFDCRDRFKTFFEQFCESTIIFVFQHIGDLGELRNLILQTTLDALRFSFQPIGTPTHVQFLPMIVSFCIDGFNADVDYNFKCKALNLFITLNTYYKKKQSSKQGALLLEQQQLFAKVEEQLPNIVQFILNQYQKLDDEPLLSQCTRLLRQIFDNNTLFAGLFPIIDQILRHSNSLLTKTFEQKCDPEQYNVFSQCFWSLSKEKLLFKSQKFYPNLYCLLSQRVSQYNLSGINIDVDTLDEELAHLFKIYYSLLPQDQVLLQLAQSSRQLENPEIQPSSYFLLSVHVTTQFLSLVQFLSNQQIQQQLSVVYNQISSQLIVIIQGYDQYPPHFFSATLWSFNIISQSQFQTKITIIIEIINLLSSLIPRIRTIAEFYVTILFLLNMCKLIAQNKIEIQGLLEHIKLELLENILHIVTLLPQEFQFYKDVYDVAKIVSSIVAFVRPEYATLQFSKFLQQQINLNSEMYASNILQTVDVLEIFQSVCVEKVAECDEATYSGVLNICIQLFVHLTGSYLPENSSNLTIVVKSMSNLLTSFSNVDYFQQFEVQFFELFQTAVNFILQRGDQNTTSVASVLVCISDTSRVLSQPLSQQIVQFILQQNFVERFVHGQDFTDLIIILRSCLGICLNFSLSTELSQQIIEWTFSITTNLDQSDICFDYVMQFYYYVVINVQRWTDQYIFDDPKLQILIRYLPVHVDRLREIVDVKMLLIYFLKDIIQKLNQCMLPPNQQMLKSQLDSAISILELGLEGLDPKELLQDKDIILSQLPEILIQQRIVVTTEPSNMLYVSQEVNNGLFLQQEIDKYRLFSCMWSSEIDQFQKQQQQ